MTEPPELPRRGVIAGLAATAAVDVSAKAAAPAGAIAYVGCYTDIPADAQGHGEGIYLTRFDPARGVLERPTLAARTPSPSWIALSPDRRFLFAANELEEFRGKPGGSISSFAVDRASGALSPRGVVASGGVSPAHASVHPSGKFLLVGNYSSANVVVFPIAGDGNLGEPTDVKTNTGPLNPDRAADNPVGNFAPSDHRAGHPHMIASDPTGRFVIVNDAGLDRTYVWAIDLATGKLTAAEPHEIVATPGSAPRHFTFHPNGRYFYNLHEQNSTLTVHEVAADGFRTTLQQTVSVLPDGYAGSNLAAELVMARDGRFVYASNRLHNTIATLALAEDGHARMVADTPTQSDYPRGLTLDPTGRYLLACNQRGDCITVFALDPATGVPAFTGQYVPVGSPVVLAFID